MQTPMPGKVIIYLPSLPSNFVFMLQISVLEHRGQFSAGICVVISQKMPQFHPYSQIEVAVRVPKLRWEVLIT